MFLTAPGLVAVLATVSAVVVFLAIEACRHAPPGQR